MNSSIRNNGICDKSYADIQFEKSKISPTYLMAMSVVLVLLSTACLQARANGWSKGVNFNLQNATPGYNMETGLSGKQASANRAIGDVKGEILDEQNLPLSGASIKLKGQNVGTVSDINGNFVLKSIELDNAVLVISFTGYKTQEITLKGRSELSVQLLEDMMSLSEIVVIGYGSVKRKDLTGSVASISGKEINNMPINNVAEAFAGRLAGVAVTQSDGAPDAEVRIRVRGGGSITQDNSPLYIVDGFVVDNINNIAPGEIQSIDVLKDASSTAIYGSRGANGVILVTTKQPQPGRFSISYNSSFGTKDMLNKYKVLDPYNYALLQYERASLNGNVAGYYEPYYGSFLDIQLYKGKNQTSWQDEVFGRTGLSQNHLFSIMGGDRTANFSVSYNRGDETAIMIGSSYARDNFNGKLSSRPFDWLETNVMARYSDMRIGGSGVNDNAGAKTTGGDSRLKASVIYPPFQIRNVFIDDEEQEIGSMVNPLSQLADNDRFQTEKGIVLNGEIALTPLAGLRISSRFGINTRVGTNSRYYGASTYYVQNGAVYKNKPAIELNDRLNGTKTWTNTASYDFARILNRSNSVNLLVGQENIVTNGRTFNNIIEDFPTFFDSEKAWAFTGEGIPVSSLNSYSADDKLLSFFGRANYSFKGKYLLTATARADGSSKFGPGNRWGYFPSSAFAWRVTDEKFMESSKDWLSFLKFRVSYGVTGNNRVPSLAFMQTYSSSVTSNISPTLATSYWNPGSRMSNPDLRWETTISRNVGMDFELFSGRLTGVLDLYKNSTKDLIVEFPLSGSGYRTQLVNLGETSNKGIELTLTSDVIQTKDLRIGLNINGAMNKNRVENIGELQQITANSNWTSNTEASNDFKVIVGQPVGLMYGFVTDGWYTEDDFTWDGRRWNPKEGVVNNATVAGATWGPGALRLKDLNGDGVITEQDRTILGNANPKHTGGINLNATFKNFDFAAQFNWVIGNNVLNASRVLMTHSNMHNNVLTDMTPGTYYTQMNYETGEMVKDPAVLAKMNENATIWSPVAGRYVIHSWAVEDGSFVRFKNLTFGYSLPEKLISKIKLQQVRLYATGVNLHLWTKYTGSDPEVDTRRSTPLTPGVDYSAYPKSRTFVGGINVTF